MKINFDKKKHPRMLLKRLLPLSLFHEPKSSLETSESVKRICAANSVIVAYVQFQEVKGAKRNSKHNSYNVRVTDSC